jgi:starch synthase
MNKTLNILFLAAEAEPFVKIGGLADVAGSLPLELRALSYQGTRGIALDVRLVLPFHRAVRVESITLHQVAKFSIYRCGGNIPVEVFEIESGGMPVYFIKSDIISNTSSVYSSDPAIDQEKYTLFSLAAMELIHYLDWHPDIVHANDWHTALAIYALRTQRTDPVLTRIHTVLTIHNLPYMGGDVSNVLSAYGLMPLNDDSMPKWAQTQPLPLGLWSADAIVPVSPTYAQEILTPDFGCGLELYLRTHAENITGILNGIDVNYWNPKTDNNLVARFGPDDFSTRTVNKTALLKFLELKGDSDVPLLVMIGRFDRQKGLDITFDVLQQMLNQKWQFVILGSGNPVLENAARRLQVDFPDRIRTVIRYDESFAHLLYGGADIFLMPSRYEPCGLAQLIAMRYGCVPVVHATGGLKDTVQKGKTGFQFQVASVGSMMEAMFQALKTYASPEDWQHMQRNGMKEDFSWPRSARKYANIYLSLISGS